MNGNGKYIFWGSVFLGLGTLGILTIVGIYQLFASIPYRSDLQVITTGLMIGVVIFPLIAWQIGYRAGRHESEGLRTGLELAMKARGLGGAKRAEAKPQPSTIPWDVNNPPISSGTENSILGPGNQQQQYSQPKIIMSERDNQVLDL